MSFGFMKQVLRVFQSIISKEKPGFTGLRLENTR